MLHVPLPRALGAAFQAWAIVGLAFFIYSFVCFDFLKLFFFQNILPHFRGGRQFTLLKILFDTYLGVGDNS